MLNVMLFAARAAAVLLVHQQRVPGVVAVILYEVAELLMCLCACRCTS
jgi:hypothetical protein